MSYYIPQWEERTSYGFRRIDPYTKLFEDRIIMLGTPISDDVANAVMAQLMSLQAMDPDRDISIYINSPGGSFTALTAIYDTIQYIKPDVSTLVMGLAASAAAVLLLAGAPGKRYALPNSRVLLHQPHGGAQGQASDAAEAVDADLDLHGGFRGGCLRAVERCGAGEGAVVSNSPPPWQEGWRAGTASRRRRSSSRSGSPPARAWPRSRPGSGCADPAARGGSGRPAGGS